MAPQDRELYRGLLVLSAAGSRRIGECEEHGWMQDSADPHARERAIDMARFDPPAGFSPDKVVAEIRQVLDSSGDTCPECPLRRVKRRRTFGLQRMMKPPSTATG